MNGVLYIVATPIGNLDDISRRAIETLSKVSAIAAEDTRHSKPLLKRLGISTKLFALHDHNEKNKTDLIITKLEGGEDIALISDAGTPLISDPGYLLVNKAQLSGIRVCPIPGASSVITALSGAGLPTNNFYYHGFLPHKNQERITQLASLKLIQSTLVLLESSHRILRLMEQLQHEFSNQAVVIAKELTKIHERFMRGTSAELAEVLKADNQLQKGEFVVLIDNRRELDKSLMDNQVNKLLQILLKDIPLKKSVQTVVEITGEKKNVVYQKALELNQQK